VSGAQQKTEWVILLHGLGRTADSMNVMAKALQAEGFKTLNIDYPSRRFPIEKLATDTIPPGLKRCTQGDASKIHFVTHSMGGIMVCYFLSRTQIPRLGRVVMISPPNRGSEVAGELKNRLDQNGPRHSMV
jgi:triacylglycerol lipase